MHSPTGRERQNIRIRGFSATMVKDNSKVCTICDKWFSSGKAMGGHMRSHFMTLPIPPNPETKNQALDNSTQLTHSSIQSPSSPNFHPKEKTTQNFRSLNCSYFASSPESNGENEFLLFPKHPTGKRSKCRRSRFIATAEKEAEPNQVSLASETLDVEIAATTLMMMSKDKWPESEEINTQRMVEAEDDRTQARFNCEMCPRVFRSAQGLGGHRAMHRRIQNLSQEGGNIEGGDIEDGDIEGGDIEGGDIEGGDIEGGGSNNNTNVADQKAVKCPYCSKVCKSAQALGGHKKIHLQNPMVDNSNTTADKFEEKLIDLNLPAPEEDEEVSPIEF